MNLDNIRIKPANRGEFEQIIALFKKAGYDSESSMYHFRNNNYDYYWGAAFSGENRIAGSYKADCTRQGKQCYDSFAEYQKSVKNTIEPLPERFAVKTPTPELARRVQQRFFDNGIKWCSGDTRFLDTNAICFNYDGDKNLSHAGIYKGSVEDYYKRNEIPLLSIFEFFSRPFAEQARQVKAGDYTFTHKSGEIRVSGPEANNVLIPAAVIKSVKSAIVAQKGKKVFPPVFTVMATKELRDYAVDKVKGNYGQILDEENSKMSFKLSIPHLQAESYSIPIEKLHEYSAPITVTGFSWPIIVAGGKTFVGCKTMSNNELEAALS